MPLTTGQLWSTLSQQYDSCTPAHSQFFAPSAFYNISCDPGFECVSKVQKFGVAHDGAYHPGGPVEGLKANQNCPNVYEVGCPARGESRAAGNCVDTGVGTKHMCWSPFRFEAGSDAPCGTAQDGLCKCVKNVPQPIQPAGSEQSAASQAGEGKQPTATQGTVDPCSMDPSTVVSNQDGDAFVNGKWKSEKYETLACRDCTQHDQNDKDCNNLCKGKCTYRTNQSIAGLKINGCFPSQEKPKGEEVELPKVEEKDLEEIDLKVIPHFTIWNPKQHDGSASATPVPQQGFFKGMKLPWDIRDRPLSKTEFLKEYQKARKPVQALMDRIKRTAATGSWDAMSCDGQGAPDSGIKHVLTGVRAAQEHCLDIQEKIQTLQPGQKIPNCYVDDPKVMHALHNLERRLKQCGEVSKALKAEEATNGPPPKSELEDIKQNLYASGGRLDADDISKAGLAKQIPDALKFIDGAKPAEASVGFVGILAPMSLMKRPSNRESRANFCRGAAPMEIHEFF